MNEPWNTPEVGKTCYLYWIKLPCHSDIIKEGYVGITYYPDKRIMSHVSEAKLGNVNKNKEFKEALLQGTFEFLVVEEGSRCDMSAKEFELRPKFRIGWNIKQGGDDGKYESKLLYSKVRDEELSLVDWSHLLGLKQNTITYRLLRGWSVDEALGLEQKAETTQEDCTERYLCLLDLEYSFIKPQVISRNRGFKSDLKRILHRHIDKISPIYKYGYLPYEMAFIKIPRQNVVTDFDLMGKIVDDTYSGLTGLELAKKYKLPVRSMKKLQEEIENAEYLTEADYKINARPS